VSPLGKEDGSGAAWLDKKKNHDVLVAGRTEGGSGRVRIPQRGPNPKKQTLAGKEKKATPASVDGAYGKKSYKGEGGGAPRRGKGRCRAQPKKKKTQGLEDTDGSQIYPSHGNSRGGNHTTPSVGRKTKSPGAPIST